jgi:hypothetical protein
LQKRKKKKCAFLDHEAHRSWVQQTVRHGSETDISFLL